MADLTAVRTDNSGWVGDDATDFNGIRKFDAHELVEVPSILPPFTLGHD
jgi:hypothetical protein